jgi:vacuolar-type H+-ATPase subunit F/Vma7
MKRILFITAGDSETGFRLAGAGQVVCDPEDALAEASKAALSGEVGLLVFDERLYAALDARSVRMLEESFAGVITVLPAPEEPGPGAEDFASGLIRRALGYRIRVKG